MYHMLLRKARH